MSQSVESLWSQYEDLGLLGWGSCSTLRRARHRLTGVTVAIKVLKKAEKKFVSIQGEVGILKTAMHPNIVSLFQIVETESHVYLVLELCQNELQEHVLTKGCLQEDEARNIFRQILCAMSYCHNHGIAHRDIKPDNVMLDARGVVKIIDFGLAVRFMPGQMFTRQCGAYTYMAPEVIQGRKYDASKKDIWSLGVLLYYMVTMTLPFKYRAFWELKEKIVRGNYRTPQHLSPHLRALIRLLLTVKPEKRPTAKDIMQHPWLQHGQGGSGYCETLPRQLDTGILSIMQLMWFDTDDVLESIRQYKFDQLRATYCLFQYQAHSKTRDNGQNKLVHPGTTPFPTPTDPAAFPLPLKRKSNVAVLRIISSCSEAQEQPEDGLQAEHKAGRWASLPSIHLSCPKKRPTVTQDPKRLFPVTAPGTPCPSPGPQLPEIKASFPMTEEKSEAHTQGPHGKGNRSELPEITISPEMAEEKPNASTPGQGSRPELLEKVATETCDQGLPSCWKALRGSIQSCLRRLFHRRPPQNFHLFRKRVSPVTAVDGGEDHEGPSSL